MLKRGQMKMGPFKIGMLFCAFILLLVLFNKKQKKSALIRDAYEELEGLASRTRRGRSTFNDMKRWERSLQRLEKYPKELNKLDDELKLRKAFVVYLERHYPEDERLEQLRETDRYQKDNRWNMKRER
ncbi:hypothetical protein D3C78_1463230 [compost metagenome]